MRRFWYDEGNHVDEYGAWGRKARRCMVIKTLEFARWPARGLINKKAKCTLPALDTQLFLAKLINKNKIIN
jgi:hypothetical protein